MYHRSRNAPDLIRNADLRLNNTHTEPTVSSSRKEGTEAKNSNRKQENR